MAESIGLGRSTATLVCTVLLISGCFGASSDNVAPFQSIDSIEAFVGDYENTGQPHRQHNPKYLSDLIWIAAPISERQKLGESIRTIQVRSTGPKTLLVRGLDANGAEVKASSFEHGKDFQVRNGVIHIESRTGGGMTGMYPMGPMAAASRTTVSLGLDRDGNAQQVEERLSAGVFIVVPVGGTDAWGKRFARIKK